MAYRGWHQVKKGISAYQNHDGVVVYEYGGGWYRIGLPPEIIQVALKTAGLWPGGLCDRQRGPYMTMKAAIKGRIIK